MMAAFSDETVMRYVDGELDDEASAELEAALATDPDLSRRIELFAETRLAAQDAMRPMLAEPVPETLKSAVETMVAKAKAEAPQKAWRVRQRPSPRLFAGQRLDAACGRRLRCRRVGGRGGHAGRRRNRTRRPDNCQCRRGRGGVGTANRTHGQRDDTDRRSRSASRQSPASAIASKRFAANSSSTWPIARPLRPSRAAPTGIGSCALQSMRRPATTAMRRRHHRRRLRHIWPRSTRAQRCRRPTKNRRWRNCLEVGISCRAARYSPGPETVR